MKNKDVGVPVYIEIHKRNKKTGNTIFIHILKIQIQVPLNKCVLHRLPPLGRSDLGDVVF